MNIKHADNFAHALADELVSLKDKAHELVLKLEGDKAFFVISVTDSDTTLSQLEQYDLLQEAFEAGVQLAYQRSTPIGPIGLFVSGPVTGPATSNSEGYLLRVYALADAEHELVRLVRAYANDLR